MPAAKVSQYRGIMDDIKIKNVGNENKNMILTVEKINY